MRKRVYGLKLRGETFERVQMCFAYEVPRRHFVARRPLSYRMSWNLSHAGSLVVLAENITRIFYEICYIYMLRRHILST